MRSQLDNYVVIPISLLIFVQS